MVIEPSAHNCKSVLLDPWAEVARPFVPCGNSSTTLDNWPHSGLTELMNPSMIPIARALTKSPNCAPRATGLRPDCLGQ